MSFVVDVADADVEIQVGRRGSSVCSYDEGIVGKG